VRSRHQHHAGTECDERPTSTAAAWPIDRFNLS
jgi:hypothetical protein